MNGGGVTFRCLDEVRQHIGKKIPTLYVGSRTSTVIPYESLSSDRGNRCSRLMIGDLSTLPPSMSLDEKGLLTVSGSVSWQEAKAFCQSKGRSLMTSPTEELAIVLAGIATSATGERCFGYGALREQISEVTFLNREGEEVVLNSKISLFKSKLIGDGVKTFLEAYQRDYRRYLSFKNAPFPRMETEIDLMVGTEGQLGVITEAKIKTASTVEVTYLFLALPKWEEDYVPHWELFQKVQTYRNCIYSCELIDENSLRCLPKELSLSNGRDLVFLEVDNRSFGKVYEELLSQLSLIDDKHIFEITASQCHEFRVNIPRYVFEKNAQRGVCKKGTDVQVKSEDFLKLLDYYRKWTSLGVTYNLFGHFGDAHLHFNFMPTPTQVEICQRKLEEFYEELLKWEGSPFAEHGIGLVKQSFVERFYGQNQKNLFRQLKGEFDPDGIFFPQGFMKWGLM